MTCYCINFGIVSTKCAGAQPCKRGSGFSQCCLPQDSCHPDGFCYSTDPDYLAGVGTNWYLGGCTDSKWNDASCPRPCEDLAKSDVVYNESISLWSCCRNSTSTSDTAPDSNCRSPGNETFSASPPEAILAATYGALSTQTTAQTSTTSVAPSTTETPPQLTSTLPSSTQTAASSNDLSTGAKAGIGVGVGVAVVGLIIIILVARTFALRRKHQRTPQILEQNDVRTGAYSEDTKTSISNHQSKHSTPELDNQGRTMTSELP